MNTASVRWLSRF